MAVQRSRASIAVSHLHPGKHMPHQLRLALVHPRRDRPTARRFHTLLSGLNASVHARAVERGWIVDDVPSADLGRAAARAAARSADAVVIMGGEDVDPRLYGGPVEYPGSGEHQSRADAVEIAIVLDTIGRGAPLLGICRGHQLVNVALGGTLVPHLPAPHRAGTPEHAAREPFVRTTLHLDTADLVPDVPAPGDVRCSHHQAVARLGAGLRIAARSTDDVVEAVVHESAPVTGVQWHPEHSATARRDLDALLARLERQRAGVTSVARRV